MRIKAIELTWFRGAADPVRLEPGGKSMVVYGMNGSGKSSFVDAVEYVLNSGRIGHLAHEYSGRRQEKALPNTHKPDGLKTELRIEFGGCESHLRVEIQDDGTFASSGGEAAAMNDWDYRRTVLRQNEVAAFIHGTKGDKYSALLPLLGLGHLELIAENLRQLARAVEDRARIHASRAEMAKLQRRREETFGADSDEEILRRTEALHTNYCPGETGTTDPLARLAGVIAAIHTRNRASSADQRRHMVLQDVARLDIRVQVAAVRRLNSRLVDTAEALITEKLAVLESAKAFEERITHNESVRCPACGRAIPVEDFRKHIQNEKERLEEAGDAFGKRKRAIGTLCSTLRSLKDQLAKEDVRPWRDGLAVELLSDELAYLDALDPEGLRTSCGEDDLKAIERNLPPIVAAAEAATRDAPPDVPQLADDRRKADALERDAGGKCP